MSTILLVEDDIMILDITRKLLELLDHKVFTATSGASTLEILKEQKGQVDLVLLDLSLPDIDGQLLIPKLAEAYPYLKIVICSAALPDELDFEDQSMVRGVLNKPFERNELREIIGKAVDDN